MLSYAPPASASHAACAWSNMAWPILRTLKGIDFSDVDSSLRKGVEAGVAEGRVTRYQSAKSEKVHGFSSSSVRNVEADGQAQSIESGTIVLGPEAMVQEM